MTDETMREERLREIEAELRAGCSGHDVGSSWSAPASYFCGCFEAFEGTGLALIAEVRRLRQQVTGLTDMAVDLAKSACRAHGGDPES